MTSVDWPLAIGLLIVFFVMSVVRWRYFKSLGRRLERKRGKDAPPPPPS